jgi:phosphoadenosine phosphosulfate reductase
MSGERNQLDLPALNELFERQDPSQIVAWAAAQFGNDLIMSSSFGADSAVLLHMAGRAAPRIRVIFVDTGYIFPQTHEFREQLKQRLDLNVHIYRTHNDPAEYLRRAGETDPTWRKDINACCAANKNEPFERAMREMAPRATIQGIRRSQTPERAARQFIEESARYNCYSISPLLNWTDRDMYNYLKKHDLPYHPLRDKGYWSIGCDPLSCTRPIADGDDPRSGRWAGQGKFECGINIINSLDSANL